MSFKDLKLGTKQRIALSVVLAIMIAANLYQIRKLGALKAEIDDASKRWLPSAVAISQINLNTTRLRSNQLQHIFATDEKSKNEQKVLIAELMTIIERDQAIYEELKAAAREKGLQSLEEEKIYDEFNDKWETYLEHSFELIALISSNQNDKAIRLLNGPAKDVYTDFSQDLVKLVEANQQNSLSSAARAEQTYLSTLRLIQGLLVGTVILAIIIGNVFVRYISVPIQGLEAAAQEVAGGNLDVQLQDNRKDEIGNLASSFNKMTRSLKAANEKTRNQALKLQAQNKHLEATMQELKEAQEQLLIKEKMAFLGGLVAGLAHEINNPAGVINSSSDIEKRCLARISKLMSEPATKGNLAELKRMFLILEENIDATAEAGHRIAKIVQSLRTFAHLDEAEYQKVNLHEGLESTITLMGGELKNRIHIKRNYGDIPEIHCFAGQLNQVFINVLRNASEAIEGEGEIDIKTYRDNGHVYIGISDTGRGIPRSHLSKIFEFGFSRSGQRVRMTSGLSTAYNIIQRHDGEIDIYSEEGKGTTVTLKLPVK
jgi:signal transduction histidine kinase